MPCCLWWNGMPKKCFRVEKLPARVKREIGLFAANSIFVSSHNCYSANAHPIGKKSIYSEQTIELFANLTSEKMPSSRQISKVLPFCSGFVLYSTQNLCCAVQRIWAVQCQRFVASSDSIFLRFPTVAVSTVGSNLGREEWEGKTHHSHKHHEKSGEKVGPIIVINIMKNTYIWGGENKVKPIVINIMKNA